MATVFDTTSLRWSRAKVCTQGLGTLRHTKYRASFTTVKYRDEIDTNTKVVKQKTEIEDHDKHKAGKFSIGNFNGKFLK